MIIKQYFTDGLIQIAIILSLLRTDLNNYLNSNLIDYPEVQDVILGQSIAYAPTNFHNHFNILNSLSGSVHPKSVDHEYFSSIFQEFRSLPRFQRFYGLSTDINAFLLETHHGISSGSISHSTASGGQSSSDEANVGSVVVSSPEATEETSENNRTEESASDQVLSNGSDVAGAGSVSSNLFGSDLTEEV